LSWNDKVNKYLPDFTDQKGEATLRQLLSHTAGYPDYQPEEKRRDDYQTLEESVTNIVNLPVDTLPGTKFHYGGLAMQVAGRMAEVATGKDWEILFQEKIAAPLNMKYSNFIPVSEEPGFNPMLGRGFKTCMNDYMNFLNMISHKGMFNGHHILSQKVIDEIESDQVRTAIVKQPEYVANSRHNYHNSIYGLGCWREEIDSTGTAILISSPGWAGAYPWVDRKKNIYGFIIAKVNGKAFIENFSSFYSSAELPLIVRNGFR
jgi:CubicO group peptidase (beta-lactamase class C family)